MPSNYLGCLHNDLGIKLDYVTDHCRVNKLEIIVVGAHFYTFITKLKLSTEHCIMQNEEGRMCMTSALLLYHYREGPLVCVSGSAENFTFWATISLLRYAYYYNICAIYVISSILIRPLCPSIIEFIDLLMITHGTLLFRL